MHGGFDVGGISGRKGRPEWTSLMTFTGRMSGEGS
jgi:hypothetical protein